MTAKKLHILRMADVSNNRTGGMSRFMHYNSDELRLLGHTVDLWFRDDFHIPCPEKIRRFVIPFYLTGKIIVALSRGQQIDLVEIHEPLGAIYGLFRKCFKSLPPFVLVSYGLEWRWYKVNLEYKRRRGLPIRICDRIFPLSVVLQARLALRLADSVSVESVDDKDFLIKEENFNLKKIFFVHGGVSPEFQREIDGASPVSRRGVLFLGSWIERKGIREVIPLFIRYLNEDMKGFVSLVGTGLASSLILNEFPRELWNRIHIAQNVTSEKTLASYYLSHQVLICPSLFEGQLLTMLEGAAAGISILSTDTSGMRDFIKKNENGVVVPVSSPTQLWIAFAELMADSKLREKLGNNAQEAVRRYTWSASAQEFIKAADYALNGSA